MSERSARIAMPQRQIRDQSSPIRRAAKAVVQDPTFPISVTIVTGLAKGRNVAQFGLFSPVLTQGPHYPHSSIGIRGRHQKWGDGWVCAGVPRLSAGSAGFINALFENPESIVGSGRMILRATARRQHASST